MPNTPMLALISPAKRLDENPPQRLKLSQPRLLKDAAVLAKILIDFSPGQIGSLLGISDKLAQLNVARYQQWQPVINQHSVAAVLMFQGDVYQGLDAQNLTNQQLELARQRLRILSGLYGLLRPFDAIQPYRLEMGCKLYNPCGSNLYAYWREPVTQLLKQDMVSSGAQVLLNLASQEYAQAVNFTELGYRVITPRFLDAKNGKTSMIQYYVKKARGLMARYQLVAPNPQDLQAFDYEGYAYNKVQSTADVPVFIRHH